MNGQRKNKWLQRTRVITDHLYYGCGQKNIKYENVIRIITFVTNNEWHKMKDKEMREIMKEYGEVKSLKLRFHLNNTRNEAICFSTEEAQLAVTEINTYVGWRAEL